MASPDMEIASAEARRADPDRWLAARFAPPAGRARLDALYAFHCEIARVRESVSEALMGEIRLRWWAEAVDEAYGGAPVRRHPVALAFAQSVAGMAAPPERDAVHGLIDARGRDLGPERFATVEEVGDYAEATAGALAALAGRMLLDRPLSERIECALRRAGRAWALAGLARAFPVHAATGWVTAPAAASEARVAAAVRERDAAQLAAWTAPLVEAASAALVEARDALAAAPQELWPAYGYLALAGPRLRALTRPDADPVELATRAEPLRDRLRLIAAAARGCV